MDVGMDMDMDVDMGMGIQAAGPKGEELMEFCPAFHSSRHQSFSFIVSAMRVVSLIFCTAVGIPAREVILKLAIAFGMKSETGSLMLVERMKLCPVISHRDTSPKYSESFPSLPAL